MAGVPTVAIVGRPNVGKSSLFNRLLRRRQALVDRIPGVTRDVLEAPLSWGGRSWRLLDTGGLAFERGASLTVAIQRQVARAIAAADLLLFVCDTQEGLLPLDHQVADHLRRSGKPILLVANKADTEAAAARAVEFHTLGVGPPLPVSSGHGRGVGELLEAIAARLPAGPADAPMTPDLRLAVVGRPNVGKSTLVNRLLGEERVTVDVAPGTTRDAVAVAVRRGARLYQVTDTAGVRRRPKLKTLVDIVSVKRSLEAIEQADGCLLLMDVAAGILADDLTLLGRILKGGCPCTVAMNKWDLVEAGNPASFTQALWRRAPFAAFVPAIATSTATGYHVDEALAMAVEVAARARQPVAREALAAVAGRLKTAEGVPAGWRGLRVVRLRQTAQRPLTVEVAVRRGRHRARAGFGLRPSDLAYVERLLRAEAPLGGIPLTITVRGV